MLFHLFEMIKLLPYYCVCNLKKKADIAALCCVLN